MDTLLQDLRYGIRTLVKRPGFTLLVALTLALGIGSNTAIFSVVNSVLLSPLPYRDPSKLVLLRTELPEQGRIRPASSGPEFFDYREQSRSFSRLGAIWYRPGALTDDALEPEEIDMGFVSAGFLDALGVEPALGRFITDEEDVVNAPRVIVLSHSLWKRRYGADRNIIGNPIEFDGVPHTVVGVMPEGFQMFFPPDAGVPPRLDAWVSWGIGYAEFPRTWRIFTLVGRLAPQVAVGEARAEMHNVAERVHTDNAEHYEGSGLDVELELLHRDVVAPVRPSLLLLFGAAGFVLLIACANVANLFLVRATGAEGEMVVRAALGASRWRLLRQLVTESALVSFLGAGLGLLLAQWGIETLKLLQPGNLPRLDELTIDGRVLGFVVIATVLTAMVFGAVSSIHVFRKGGDTAALKVGARSLGDAGRQRVRRLLVVGELALSLMLLIGAGLLVRSFILLAGVDPGFNPSGVLTMKLSLVDSHYPYSGPQKIAEFYRQLHSRVLDLPGVESVGATTELPLDGQSFRLAPYAYETPEGVLEWDRAAANYLTVTPGWFEAIGARLKAGRFFEWTDDLDHPNVVIVDDKLAKLVWPDRDPIGQRLQIEIFMNGRRPVWAQVIGVVEHLRHHPSQIGVEQVYVPHPQSPMRTMALAIRSEVDERTLAGAIRSEVRQLNADQPVHGVRPYAEYFGESMAATRFALSLLALFAVMALALASVGIYGVIAYGVSQRTREIGVRLAMGATPNRILQSILGQGAMLTAAGLGLGLLGAVGLSRFLASFLYGVTATDPMTFAGIPLLLAVVALAACYLPARRASKLEPTRALREE
jgi:putative ABC transport system permease protein